MSRRHQVMAIKSCYLDLAQLRQIVVLVLHVRLEQHMHTESEEADCQAEDQLTGRACSQAWESSGRRKYTGPFWNSTRTKRRLKQWMHAHGAKREGRASPEGRKNTGRQTMASLRKHLRRHLVCEQPRRTSPHLVQRRLWPHRWARCAAAGD
jgi:hypothetical protein